MYRRYLALVILTIAVAANVFVASATAMARSNDTWPNLKSNGGVKSKAKAIAETKTLVTEKYLIKARGGGKHAKATHLKLKEGNAGGEEAFKVKSASQGSDYKAQVKAATEG